MVDSQKGISPLIATVLIIGFTVALAAVIMMWGTKFTRDVQKSTEKSAESNVVCAQDVILEINGACRQPDTTSVYNISISNNGRVDVSGLNIKLYKSNTEIDSAASSIGITKFDTETISVEASGGQQNIKMVEVIPTIALGGDSVTCASNVVSYGDLDGAAFAVCP